MKLRLFSTATQGSEQTVVMSLALLRVKQKFLRIRIFQIFPADICEYMNGVYGNLNQGWITFLVTIWFQDVFTHKEMFYCMWIYYSSNIFKLISDTFKHPVLS